MTGTTGVCVVSDGLLARRDEGKITIIDRSGNPQELYTRLCACKPKWSNSYNLCEIETMTKNKYLVDVCYDCGTITVVDRKTGLEFKTYQVTGNTFDAVCAGPKGTVFLTSSNADVDTLLQLQYEETKKTFHQIMKVKCPATDVLYMKCIEQRDMLILSSFISGQVTSVKLSSLGNKPVILWKLEGAVEGRKFGSRGVCNDLDDRVYVADMNRRVIVPSRVSGRGYKIGPVCVCVCVSVCVCMCPSVSALTAKPFELRT